MSGNPKGVLMAALALLLGAIGLVRFHHGVQQRLDAEPPGLVAGPGLLPGEVGAELRTPTLLALPSPRLRSAGAPDRRLGSALMAAALALALAGGGRTEGWVSAIPRLLWVALGAGGLWLLMSRASAAVSMGSLALDGFWSGAPLYGLGLLLAVLWRPRPPGRGTTGYAAELPKS